MHIRLFIATCASAALLSAAACTSSNTQPVARDANGNPVGTSGTAAPAATSDEAKNEPVSLTGCLQKGDGHSDYILTELSEPTPGRATGSDKVEREQVNAAQHSFRLNAGKNVDDKDWDKLVGKKVKVDGTMTERSQVATSGSKDSNDRPKIHEGDLAQVDVNAISQAGASCGGANPRKR